MAIATKFDRAVLTNEQRDHVATCLQPCLCDLIDLNLLLKQAHWNVVGPNFRSLHLQLDEILEDSREGMDEVAERMATIGVSPDGRSGTVAQTSTLKAYPEGFNKVDDSRKEVADAMVATIKSLRKAQADTADHDPVTEDLVIGVAAKLEKHLWMVQAQEQ